MVGRRSFQPGGYAFGARRGNRRGMGGDRRALRPVPLRWQRAYKALAGNSAHLEAINWEAGQTLWVQVDSQHKRILVGVPMGSATQPNQVLMLDYTEGFGDPLVAALSTPERSRKWAPWLISANSCGLIERSTGVAQIFLGTNNSTGKIYGLTPGQYSDDGAAINSYYTTAFLAATGLSGRNLFGYLTGYVQGAGSLALTALYPGSAASLSLGSWTLCSPASRDMEQGARHRRHRNLQNWRASALPLAHCW